MDRYMVISPLYNERAGRVLHPGEILTLDQDQAAVLTARGIVVLAGPEVKGKKAHPDPETDKISDNDL